MANPFANLMHGWARRRYRKEAEAHLTHLRTLSDENVGLVLAIAMHQRNKLESEGAEMRDLSAVAAAEPMYQHELAKAVNALVRHSRQHDALGLQVWVHSLRCAADPGLTGIGRAIWQELGRGRGHIAKARGLVKKETGFELDIAMAHDVPAEFS